jgi:enamine deaminase RidA (YjgF/YER057c/UK114 family)
MNSPSESNAASRQPDFALAESDIAPINPAQLAAPIGFAHGMATRGGRILWLAGQNGMDAEGRITAPGDIIAQTDLTLTNILAVVEAAGGRPEHVVKLHFYVSDLEAYRSRRRELGQVWKRHFGRWYPAMMLLGVTGFFEADALIEIDGYAVIPDQEPNESVSKTSETAEKQA